MEPIDIDSDTDSELLIRMAFLLSDLNEHIEEAQKRGIKLRLNLVGQDDFELPAIGFEVYAELKAVTLL